MFKRSESIKQMQYFFNLFFLQWTRKLRVSTEKRFRYGLSDACSKQFLVLCLLIEPNLTFWFCWTNIFWSQSFIEIALCVNLCIQCVVFRNAGRTNIFRARRALNRCKFISRVLLFAKSSDICFANNMVCFPKCVWTVAWRVLINSMVERPLQNAKCKGKQLPINKHFNVSKRSGFMT